MTDRDRHRQEERAILAPIFLDNESAQGVADAFGLPLEDARAALEIARDRGAPAFRWEAIAQALATNASDADCIERDGDDVYVYLWLGSCLALMPSGKIYALWTSNQSAQDVAMDALWLDSMEAAASYIGAWIGSPDGAAGDDVFVCIDAEHTEEALETSATLAAIIASHN